MVAVEAMGAVMVMLALMRATHLRDVESTGDALHILAIGLMVVAAMFLADQVKWPRTRPPGLLRTDPLALLGLLAILRIAYDTYRYANAPPDQEAARARSYFIIFYQALIFPIAAMVVFALHALLAVKQVTPACGDNWCRIVNPPDRLVILGAVVYPILATLATLWRPRWMEWTVTPR